MAAPVWILSVDLQTKTATFQSGMADAARSARSAFKEIQSGAGEMGEGVNRGSLDVRHALGLVDNTIRGAHSMAMADLIRMFKDSALVMGALPFAMTVAGFALVAEMVYKGVQAIEAYRQAQAKLKDDQAKFGTTIQDVFNGLNDKILEAEKTTDELSGNHLGALHKELELIDHQSLSDLEHSFETISKAADQLFGDLKAGWYQMGIGSEGAKHALDEFQTQYASLLAQGKGTEAAGLLSGTLAQAKHILAMQQQILANSVDSRKHTGMDPAGDIVKYNAVEAASLELKKAGVGITDREVQSQQALVDALQAQVHVEQQVSTLKAAQDTNARLQEAKQVAKQDKTPDVSEGRARMMSDLYAEYEQKVAIVQQGEREILAETKEGTAARLQAIEDAMGREEADGLQDTAFYKQLATQKIELQRQLGEQQKAQAAAMGREQIDSDEKMGELQLAAAKEQQDAINSGKRVSLQKQMEQSIQFANEDYNVKLSALQREIEALNQEDQKYLADKQKLQNQEKQLTQQHENELAAIREKAEMATNQKLANSYQQFTNTIAGSMSQLIMGHQTVAKTFESLGDQMISSMIKNGIMYAMSNKARQASDAKAAASAGFKWGMEHGGPAAPILAPVLAATAFAGAMAFEKGGIVPGVGSGDIVPAMLTPGEGVVPDGVMDGLRSVARNGGFDAQGPHTHVNMHVHMHASALDSDGVDKVFTKHADTIQKHFEKAVRRTNR